MKIDELQGNWEHVLSKEGLSLNENYKFVKINKSRNAEIEQALN